MVQTISSSNRARSCPQALVNAVAEGETPARGTVRIQQVGILEVSAIPDIASWSNMSASS